ncbi:DUF2288 domain-containing protein [Geminocystis sp. NIES-3709]|uniref:DUF2288 domain-containing protein n=1 Tax=Geminocystis sp. NIES-3709 TaxID=1617448 RepID=UPI0005FC8077|nr:DUF2288 domain-containing protein [Geminocystis sp. NIES-3709]BAQ64287.1 hypothetical protein GM3709_1052 [Geminocystis sp. NIES-3709]
MSDLKAQLKEQLAQMDWKDLIPHAQRDALIIVDRGLDLIEVGCAIAEDKTELVQRWISEQLIQKPSTQQLSLWNGDETQKFNTIIVQPFVLISTPS